MYKKWNDIAWEQYIYWQNTDRKTLSRINQLIRDTERDPFRGIGKPEPLKGSLSGLWSRRIDDKNRLIYRVKGDTLEILLCGSHYDEFKL